jgi:hypothetical protein
MAPSWCGNGVGGGGFVARVDPPPPPHTHTHAHTSSYPYTTAQVVRALVDAGALPTSQDRWGSTPYDDAARKGFRAIIELLEAHVSDSGEVALASSASLLQCALALPDCPLIRLMNEPGLRMLISFELCSCGA